MFIHAVLSLLLLLVLLPIVSLTILGTTLSTRGRTGGVLVGIVLLLSVVSIPWWFVLAGRDVSGLWIAWGGVVGAIIGALTPTIPLFIKDSRLLRRQGYTWGLFATRQDAKDTLKWDLVMIFLTIAGSGGGTILLGALLGVGACVLTH